MAQNDFWGKFKKGIKRATSAAADFTEEQASIGKLKFEILNLKRKIDRLHGEMGVRIAELYHESPKPDPFRDSEIKTALQKVFDLEKQVDEKRRAISKVADDFRVKAENAKAAKEQEVEPPKRTAPRAKTTGSDEKAEPAPKPKRKYTRRKPLQKTQKKADKAESKKATPRKRGRKKKDEPPSTPEPAKEQ